MKLCDAQKTKKTQYQRDVKNGDNTIPGLMHVIDDIESSSKQVHTYN